MFLVLGVVPHSMSYAKDGFPKLANYYLHWELDEAAVQELARYDVVVLDMETQVRSPELVRKLKILNPHIILLVYITAEEIQDNAANSASVMRRKLANEIPDLWYLTAPSGQHLSFWSGTSMLNLADNGPMVNGERFPKLLARFVTQELLSSGLWDGVFYDNTWDGISWFTTNVDFDHDGNLDTEVDEHWRSGLRYLFNETRRLTGDQYLIVGNGGTKAYQNELNGLMLENFPNTGGWSGTMDIYHFYEQGQRTPHVMIINRTTLNSGKRTNYRSMRFGLASALLGNGYYGFDYGDKDHGQLWWYDEYNAKLGDPIGAPVSLNGNRPFTEGVWRREFKNGVAIVNAAKDAQDVDLGGEYEKLIGQQDPTTNDGSITDKVHLSGYDGLIMYKTFKTVQNVFFKNGSFVRFFKADGTRARNGFFAFEEGFPGGAKIYNGDLDGDGTPEKIVATGAKLEIFNSQGEHWFNEYPFGNTNKGELNIAVGRVAPGQPAELVVASSVGGAVKVYNYHGEVIHDSVYPLGKKYRGGFSVAIGQLLEAGDIILGVGQGKPAEILVYNSRLTKQKKRFSAEGRFIGGVNVAVGDWNGDGHDEIAAIRANGKNVVVRLFGSTGQKLGTFPLTTFFGNQAFALGAVDPNASGKQEIVVMSAN